jgi:hypothetical protein
MLHGRNKVAMTLLSGENVSFKTGYDHFSSSFEVVPLPETVLDNQLGISIFKPGRRVDLIDDLKRVVDFNSTYPDDEEVISIIFSEIKNYNNILGLVNSWKLSGHIDFQYRGESTASMPPTPHYGLLIATVVEIDLNSFKNLAASSFPRAQMLNDASLKESLTELKRVYSNQEIIYYALFDSIVNLSPVPLKISFKNLPISEQI